MKHLIAICTIVFALFPALSVAQDAPSGSIVVHKRNGVVSGTSTFVAQGAITDVDQNTRNVTIKGGGGHDVTLVAGPEVRNFAQLKVGDIVTMRITRSLTFELKKGGTALRERVEHEDAARAEAGEKPAGAVSSSVHVITDVTAVNQKAGTIRLRGPERTIDLKVRDKALLKNIAVGDQVEADYVEATMISVDAAKPTKKDK